MRANILDIISLLRSWTPGKTFNCLMLKVFNVSQTLSFVETSYRLFDNIQYFAAVKQRWLLCGLSGKWVTHLSKTVEKAAFGENLLAGWFKRLWEQLKQNNFPASESNSFKWRTDIAFMRDDLLTVDMKMTIWSYYWKMAKTQPAAINNRRNIAMQMESWAALQKTFQNKHESGVYLSEKVEKERIQTTMNPPFKLIMIQ